MTYIRKENLLIQIIRKTAATSATACNSGRFWCIFAGFRAFCTDEKGVSA